MNEQVLKLKIMINLLERSRRHVLGAIVSALPTRAHANKRKGVVVVDGSKYEIEKFPKELQEKAEQLRIADEQLAELKEKLNLYSKAN